MSSFYSVPGTPGPEGPEGPAGEGVPVGGSTGQALVKASATDYDTEWANVTAVAALDDLTDVTLTTPSDGQVLEYDSATSQWINATPSGGSATPAGSAGELQINDGLSPAGLGAVTGLKWDSVNSELDVPGDITLDDGVAGSVTTLQTITPTQNNTISLPNATGTLALVAGSSGQPVYNNAGAYAGLSTATIGTTGNITLSLNGAVSTTGNSGVPVAVTGTWVTTGGNATTTKPQVLIEPTGTTSTAWSPSGTGLGVNAPSGFSGNLLDLQVNGTTIAAHKDGLHYLVGSVVPSLYIGSSTTTTVTHGGSISFGASTTLGSGIGVTLTGRRNGELLITSASTTAGIGIKVGTDPLTPISFFGASPVSRPTAVADATDAATAITQLNALLSRMRDLGLIAP